MRIAVLADIHANLEALVTAAQYLQGHPVDEIVVLGDTVGYGADPNPCFEWVMKNAAIHLMGNHEMALANMNVRGWFSDQAREAIVWTERAMDKRYLSAARELPLVTVREGYTIVHGSLYEPEKFHYTLSLTDAGLTFAKMKNNLCFVGHSHVPCVFSESERKAMPLRPGVFPIKKTGRYVLNPGAVGQPRDGDPRLSFGILDEARYHFELIRLSYPNDKAAAKIRKAGLPGFLADRLL